MLKTHVLPPSDFQALSRAHYLAGLLGDRAGVVVFPDAADERWGIPTGVLVRAKAAEALLFPALLRDPGCGFLVFQVEWAGFTQMQADLCRALSAWAETFEDPAAGRECAARLGLPLTAEETGRIAQGFGGIINTLEIRSSYTSTSSGIADGDLIGFLHGGCEGFAGVLEERFGLPAAEYALEHGLFPEEAVAEGFFAFPYASPAGQEYARWLQAGMELSRRSRLRAFDGLCEAVRAFDPSIRLRFLWDTVHSGIEIEDGEVVTYRGAQRMGGVELIAGSSSTQPVTRMVLVAGSSPTQAVPRMALIAGHRETSACLVLPGNRAQDGAAGGPSRLEDAFACHGTPSIDYTQNLGPVDLPALRRAVAASCDTPKNYHTVAKLEQALRGYIEKAAQEQILIPAAWLAPRINIQGRKRKARAMQAQPPPPTRKMTLDDYRIELREPFRIASDARIAPDARIASDARTPCDARITGECRTAAIVLDRNLPEVTDGLCNQLIERAVTGEAVTPFDLFVIESGSERDRLSRYTSHHFVDEAAVKVGLRIARGLNAGVRLLPGYDFYGFFTNDVVLTHPEDTIATAQAYFDRYPRIGLIECLGAADGFEQWDPHIRAGRPVDVGDFPLFYTPYPIIRALFLRGELVQKLGPDVLCPENWRNWGNDEDLGFRTWQAGYFVAASARLSIHEETFLSTKKHVQVRTEDEATFKREARAQMEAFIDHRYQTDIATLRRNVFNTMLACVDDRLPVICSRNLIRTCTP